MGYSHISTYGDGDSYGSDAMVVHVCKGDGVGTTLRNVAASGVEEALKQLYNAGSIDGWRIEEYDTTCNLDCDGSGLLDQWTNWRENRGLTDRGSWLLVHGCHTSVAVHNGNAWNTDLSAIVKTDWFHFCDKYAFQGVAVQEVFHNYLSYDSECTEKRWVTNGEGDHALGDDIYYNGDYKRTPMCINYDDKKTSGDCNDNHNQSDCGGNKWLNWCEEDGIKYSRQCET
ncbi:hypothetical protein BRC81_12570 [Halobacteriales archaeon QS_1_68_20]|nr:MAG: hypothetical protein BRC81_12570 [Halobacteriales archaeon QS_1_68_20]